MEQDRKLIDIKTCGLTLDAVIARVNAYKIENPGYEVFLDGDAYAIVARRMV